MRNAAAGCSYHHCTRKGTAGFRSCVGGSFFLEGRKKIRLGQVDRIRRNRIITDSHLLARKPRRGPRPYVSVSEVDVLDS